MRMARVSVSVVVMFTLFEAGCARQESEQELRASLEKAYASFTQACRDGDVGKYEESVSTWHFASTKNNYASTKRELTGDSLKGTAEYLPDIAKLTFVKLFRNGPTAGLLYREDSTEGGKPSVTFTFIKFIREKGAWRYHAATSDTTNNARAQFDASSLSPLLQIDGKVPAAPGAAKAAEVVGLLDITSTAYRTQVTINGTAQDPIEKTSSSGIIRGGLRFGTNDIEITFRKLGDSVFTPTVRVRAQLDGKKLQEVFSFKPEQNIAGMHKKQFTIPKK